MYPIIQPKTQRRHLYTPLRYPGGKTSLFEFFDKIITTHSWENTTYVEPYAGGAGAAISLLVLGKVQSIVINDFDVAIFSFWESILEQTDRFITKIESTPTTIAEWEKQKAIYTNKENSDPFELGFATFYLNRTNRSGILNAGPVGGKSQSGKWKLDARYNKQKMINKIRLIALYKEHITISQQDGVEVIEKYSKNPDAFFYIDPPYYVKGAILYMNSFNPEKHQELARTLHAHADGKWILSYDNVTPIKTLYESYGFDPEVFSLGYSAHAKTRVGSEIMIFSDSIDKSLLRQKPSLDNN